MFISKTHIDKQAIMHLGHKLYGTKRTHDNDLVALEYMSSDDLDPYDALRNNEYSSLIKYTFCWIMRPDQYYKYIDAGVEVLIKKIANEDGYMVYLCFFTASLDTWAQYSCNEERPPNLRDEIRTCLSKDGYSLLFKEVKLLK